MTTMVAPGDFSDEQPWFPLAEPVEFPDRVKPSWVGKIARGESDVLTIERVIRSHLHPLHPGDNVYTAAWRTFWRALAFGDRRNVVNLLNDWMAKAEFAAKRPDLPDEEEKWVRRFMGDVKGALGRMARGKEEPMAWAGAEFAKYAPEMRFVVEGLIGAIALHRDGEVNNMELYGILQVLNVDPIDSEGGMNPENLEAVKNSCRTGDPLELLSSY